MRKVILRAPETDRKLVEIPTSLGDLLDYGASHAHGFGTVSTTAIIEPFTSENLSFDTTSELDNVTGGTTLTADVAGLYLCIVTIHWGFGAVDPVDREFGISKNGAASFEQSLRIVDDNARVGSYFSDDQGSFIVRLAVGDTVQPRVQDYSGVASEATAVLQMVKLAP